MAKCISRRKDKNLGKLRPSGQLANFCRMRIMIRFWQPFRQANRWSQLSPSGTAPAARYDHTSVWSDVADGMYVFGGRGGGRGLSVNGLRAERAAALHGFAEVSVCSMTCIFSTARRREGGICRRCFWKNSSGGLMRSDDLT